MDWSKYMAFPTPPVGQHDAQQYKQFASGIDGTVPDLRTPGHPRQHHPLGEDAQTRLEGEPFSEMHGLDPSAFQREVRFQVSWQPRSLVLADPPSSESFRRF